MVENKNLQTLLEAKIIPVIRGANKKNILSVVDALAKGGITVVEITVEEENGYEALELVAKERTNVLAGAGTVWDVEQAKKVVKAGANFIFSPILEEEVVTYTKQAGLVSIPGVFTPSEIYQAYRSGADIVKIFPIDILGSKFLKNVTKPLPVIPKIVTGGINLNNIEEYLNVGAVGVGVGSDLVNMRKIEANPKKELKELEDLAAVYISKAGL